MQSSTDGLTLALFHEGNGLARQGHMAEAIKRYRAAITLGPNCAPVLSNLGNALMILGQREEAIAAWRRAIAADPHYALPRSNLGSALSQQGRLDESIAHLRQAITLKPDFVDAFDHLARTLLAAGQASQALHVTLRAIAIRPTAETKKIFVDCLRHVSFACDEPELRTLLVEALAEPWARPDRLIGPAAALARQNPAIAACVDPVVKAWPARLPADVLWSDRHRAAIASDPLLRSLLVTAPICDLDLERFLTSARAVLLRQAQAATLHHDQTELAFWCALAQQCFINEYVFALDDGEFEAAERLWQALEAALAEGREVPPLRLAALGAYRPLHALTQAASLLARSWPPVVEALIDRQLREPLEEAADRAAIMALTPIKDMVSCSVRQQYEEHPYPRWIEMPPANAFETFDQYLHSVLPWWRAPARRRSDGCDILVAGCGTGHHSIDVARRSKDARVLAIDLSLTSLAYARRKTRALALTNLKYAQADILEAGSITRRFDVIESGGVLHHLDDPMAGWRALLGLLRPGGFMFLGLYSERGRQGVVAARQFIAARGYAQTADGIRRFRQDVASATPAVPLGNLLTSPDFFTVSGCRDLFFHACERRMSLPQIKSFLREHNLTFLGFHLEAQALQNFRRRHPGEAALTDLDLWHDFETDHPHTFGTMYQFWIQTPA